MTPVLAADPDNPAHVRTMRDIHRQNAAVTLRWKGWVGARNHQRQALVLTRKLALADPADAGLQRDLLGLTRSWPRAACGSTTAPPPASTWPRRRRSPGGSTTPRPPRSRPV